MVKLSQTNQIWSLIPLRFVGKATKKQQGSLSHFRSENTLCLEGLFITSFFPPTRGRISENFWRIFVRNILHDFILLAFSHFENDKVEKFLPRGLAPLSRSHPLKNHFIHSLPTTKIQPCTKWSNGVVRSEAGLMVQSNVERRKVRKKKKAE